MADSRHVEDAAADVPVDHRRFGYWAGHFVVVGSMIGAGILTTSGFTLRETGNPAALLGLWVVGGLIALCGAVTVAELATALPRSGGDYVFVREAFGRGAGFVSGWGTFTLGFAAPTAVIANLSVTYLTTPYGDALSALMPAWAVRQVVPFVASILILVIGVIHTRGHHHSSLLQVIATSVTAAILVTLAVGGILLGTGDWKHLSASSWPRANQWPALAVGLIYVGYAYGGWNAAAYLAGEMRDPARVLPRCLIGGAATVIVLYLLVNLAYVYALDPVEMMGKSEEDVKPVAALAAHALFGPATARVIAAILGLGLLATVSAALLTGPRVAFAMAQDRVFPGYAARLHPTRGTPVAATLTQVAIAVVLVWAGSLEELLSYAAVGLAALSGLTVASVFPLRRRAGLAHPYRLPLYPLPPLAYLILIVWTIGNTLMQEKQQIPALLSLATILIGIPLSRLIPGPAGNPEGGTRNAE